MTLLQQALEALEKVQEVSARSFSHATWEAMDEITSPATTALREAIKQGMVVQQWQTIESAPKDGAFVLLAGGTTSEDDYNEIGVESSRPVTAKWLADPYCESDSSWVYDFWDGDWRSSYAKPTHWQPLPAAPKEQA